MTIFDMYLELAHDIGFGPADEARLTAARPLVLPHLAGLVDRFYEVLTANAEQRAVFEGDAQIARQKVHLESWLEGLFGGVYDEAYFERRARIGRAHVRIRLPQRYMVSMMNVLRMGLHDILRREATAAGFGLDAREATQTSIDKLLDIELAVMLETFKEDYDQRARARERLASLGQLAASIGHELRNPLAVIDSSTHLLARRLGDDPRMTKHLERIREQVARSNHIITDLLELARDRAPVREDVTLGVLAQRGLEGLSSSRCTFEVRVDPAEARVCVDASQVQQVLFNIAHNALQAAAGRVEVDVSSVDDELQLTIDDDGPGLSIEVRANLFEPLFTTRTNGIGLGLWLSKRIVDKHGGTIEATHGPLGGARFVVKIPPLRPR